MRTRRQILDTILSSVLALREASIGSSNRSHIDEHVIPNIRAIFEMEPESMYIPTCLEDMYKAKYIKIPKINESNRYKVKTHGFKESFCMYHMAEKEVLSPEYFNMIPGPNHIATPLKNYFMLGRMVFGIDLKTQVLYTDVICYLD